MKLGSQSLSVIFGGLWMAALPAVAHHSLGAEYVVNMPITLNGKVTKVEWTNPHAHFYIDVKDQNGHVMSWELELGSPNGLMRRGWSSTSLKPCTIVRKDGFSAEDGTP